jgi:hypothetical protein
MPGTGEVEAWKKNTWASPFDLPPFVQLYLTCISVAGIYLKKRAADGFPMKAVGNDLSGKIPDCNYRERRG